MGARLYVISGPSGAGKGTIVKGITARRPDLFLSVSATTRPARPTERQGIDYYFVSEREFLAMRDRSELLEWAQVHHHFYGTPRAPVEIALGAGRDALLEIDVQGAAQVKKARPESVLLFIEPPSIDELERRLRKRRTEQEDALARRMRTAFDELKAARAYDAVIVNEEVEGAVDEILRMIAIHGSASGGSASGESPGESQGNRAPGGHPS